MAYSHLQQGARYFPGKLNGIKYLSLYGESRKPLATTGRGMALKTLITGYMAIGTVSGPSYCLS